jgi:hypothetical protein
MLCCKQLWQPPQTLQLLIILSKQGTLQMHSRGAAQTQALAGKHYAALLGAAPARCQYKQLSKAVLSFTPAALAEKRQQGRQLHRMPYHYRLAETDSPTASFPQYGQHAMDD